MKIPVLIFLISGIAASQLEPVASRIRHKAVEYARQNDSVRQLSGQLADAQLEMMGVLRSSHDSPEALQNHEAGLKYALRAEQIRLAEKKQCRQGAGVHC
jgi:hypothetical protein